MVTRNESPYQGENTESGLLHDVIVIAASLNYFTQVSNLLQSDEFMAFDIAGYQVEKKRLEATDIYRQVVIRPGKLWALDKNSSLDKLLDWAEQFNARARASAENKFRIIKCQFYLTKVHYKRLSKPNTQLIKLFALSNLWIARKRITKGSP